MRVVTTHLDSPGVPGILVRTGVLVPFRDVSIGQPFWAHGKVWTRTSREAASAFGSTNQRVNGFIFLGNCCNFVIDPIDKMVEALEFRSETAERPWVVEKEDRS